MVLDTYAPAMLDLTSIVHPLVMATTTTTTTTSDSDSGSSKFTDGLVALFCDNETFAAYCTITRNADGTTSKSITTDDWLELGGIGLAVGALVALYGVIGFVGLFAFPPMIICLSMQSGDLDTCSLGLFK